MDRENGETLRIGASSLSVAPKGLLSERDITLFMSYEKLQAIWAERMKKAEGWVAKTRRNK